MTYLKVEGHSNLIRDESTNAIISTDYLEYQNYLNIQKKTTNDKKRIQNLESEITSLKNDISEIKNLLIKISNESR